MFHRFSRRRVRPLTPRPAAPSLESLESRRLYAADPGGTATIDTSTPRLDVEGTRKADQINVDLNTTTGKIDVVINGAAAGSFDPALITAGIRIDGRAGNDTIVVGSTITLPVEIRGDKGNDNITGGSGDDTIDAGPGRDTCAGGVGDDSVRGGAGNDSLSGNAGSDDIDGENGNDSCDGGDDSDSVAGGNGRDSLVGSLGDDRLLGGKGRDDCDGNDGDDDLDGGPGRDDLNGGPGTDDFNDAPDDGPRGRGRGADDNIEDRQTGENEADDNIPAGDVPAAVMTAFNTRYPGATVREIERELEHGAVQIKIDFLTGGRRMRARFTEAGEFIEEEVR
jgi:Ca2+-binding RTX toxin-like protein